MTERCIIFLHVPKSGGVTLRNVFRWKYPRSQQLRVESLEKPLEELEKLPLSKRRDARVVMGHFHYGVHRYIPNECAYVTVLREPVARVLSMYRFIRGEEHHWLHDRIIESDMSLEEFVETCADPGVDNHQTRLISGRRDDFVSGQRPRELDQDALEEAKNNLDSFLAFGLIERFDESFILIRRALGWKLPLYITGNVSARRSESPSQAAIDAIRERNQFDLELYDFARERFSSIVEEKGASLQREVAAFKVLNRIPNKVFPRAEGLIRRALSSKFPSKPAR